MVELQKIKEFLKIDTDAEDTLLGEFAKTAEEYLINSCGQNVDLTCSRAETVQLMLISDWFENRSLYANGSYSRAISSMLMQLQLEAEAEVNEI